MIVSIEGNEATGKTTLALTAPLPIVMFSLDLGAERAIYGTHYEQFFKGLDVHFQRYVKGQEPDDYTQHDITVYELPTPIQLDNDKLMGYMEQWQYFIGIFARAIVDPYVKTVVVDTMTLLRKNKCDAYLQELQGQGKPRKQLQQMEYSHPDGAIRTLYTYAQSAGKNFIGVHHLRPHYTQQLNRDGTVESMPQGEEIDGVRDTLRYVDVALRNEKDKGKLKSQIVKCGPNLGFEGTPIANATWDKLVEMLEVGWHGRPYDRRHPEAETSDAGK